MLGEDDIVSAGPSQSDFSADTEATPLLRATTSTASSSTMVEKNIGISQQTLVSNAGDRNVAASKKLPQYMAGVAATLGALAMGMVLGWASAAGEDGKNLISEYKISMTKDEFSWITSLVTLGAAAICVPIGILSDLIGRKTAMLILVVPFTVGWLLIVFANSLGMFYIGRFITGVSGGAFCVTAPMYTAEIAENSIRGTLGSYFQLMLTVGILVSYVLGPMVSMFQLSLISTVIPVIFFCVFFFMPETPIYYLKKGNLDAARASMVRLRGPHYNVEPEIQAQQEILDEAKRNSVSFFEAIQGKAAIKGLIIGFGLMFFQQLSGVNAIIFYASTIFGKADKSIPPTTATIIVGVIQVVAVFLSTLVVDRLGRRILLLVSIVAMFITTLILGVYFYLQIVVNADVSNIGWLPLLCICTFIFLFSMGFGPIPWMMMGEIFSSTVKGIAGSSACLFNWLMAFVVTRYYVPLENSAGAYTCFWIFSVVCAVGTLFIFFVVPETKGKTLEEIQYELGGEAPTPRRDSGKA
ncbi:facilitated trehalose transporter Tret1-2 homolog isoform X1 [Nasonia vitripennis]|uniref:Major facilitator superfamily (MFS) profile domain-containing protein n=2 Tax=Nasonia vitripennis TaxID=7425 RepID=A0A7M7TAT2_NASVI|nr:facilitated trehalose transporter Tret1-2 homolog isoform X1 [Nasonia vitripennis]